MNFQRRFNIEMQVLYQSNTEYRAELRKMFYMDVSPCALDIEHLDFETRDELEYDENKISSVMDDLFLLTKGNAWFQKLYDSAAEKMFSTNREIGQAVLFSYDYLPLFHKCLASFIKDPSTFDETNEFYVALSKKIV
jgi:hypothetical protein